MREPPAGTRIAEHDLVAAVLHVGIVDAVSERGFIRDRIKAEERQAWLWIMGGGDPEQPFTFEWCCWHLDLDPDLIRSFVKTAKRIGIKRGYLSRRSI